MAQAKRAYAECAYRKGDYDLGLSLLDETDSSHVDLRDRPVRQLTISDPLDPTIVRRIAGSLEHGVVESEDPVAAEHRGIQLPDLPWLTQVWKPGSIGRSFEKSNASNKFSRFVTGEKKRSSLLGDDEAVG